VSRYYKFLVALVPALLAALKVLSDALGDGNVSAQEWTALAIAFLGALAVYAVPNTKPADEPYDPAISEGEADDPRGGVIR
jgi:hypothetical protein